MSSSFRSLFKHTTIYAIGNALQRGAGFLLLPLYLNLLTPTEYGSLELIYSVSAIFAGVLGAGLAHATLRFYFEYDSALMSRRVVSTTLIATATLSGSAVAVSLPFSDELAGLLFEGRHELGISIAFGTVFFELIRQIGLAFFRAKEYSTRFVTVAIIQFLIQVFANIYTVAVLELGVEGVLIGNFVAVLLGTCYVTYATVRECGLKFDLSICKSIAIYAHPFIYNSLISTLTDNADRFLIRYFLSLEAVGIYALAMKFSQLLRFLIIDSFQLGFGSYRFSIMKESNAKVLLTRLATYYVAAVTLSAVAICVLSGDLIRLISQPTYWGAVGIVPLLILATVVGSTGYIFQTGILYEKSTGRLVQVNLIRGTTVLLLDVLLIPALGVIGASLALIGSAVAGAFSTNALSQKLYCINWHYKKAMLIWCWGIAIVFASSFHPLDVGLLSIFKSFGFLVVFVAGIFLFNMLYGGEVQQVRAMFVKGSK